MPEPRDQRIREWKRATQAVCDARDLDRFQLLAFLVNAEQGTVPTGRHDDAWHTARVLADMWSREPGKAAL